MAAKPKIMTNLAPTDHWSVKEKLCLASSVMRSGDQNWVSVSRAVKPFAEPAHQPEFFSQKNCAKQYSAMLENVDTPKRKRSSERGEVVETPGDLIVKKMSLERIDELKAQIREDKVLFKQLKKEIDDIRSGSADDKLQDMWNEMQSKKKATEEEAEPSKPTTETVKSAKSSAVPTPGKSKRPTSRTSKTSRTSEGSEASAIDVIGKEDDGDSVFDPAASSDTLALGLTDKHKIETETQESNDSIGGAEGSDVDVTAVSDIKPGTSTLSKLLTKGKTSSSSSISPIEPPSQPSLSSASKASAAKEAAKILLSGAGASASEEKDTDKKATDKKPADKKATDKKDEKKDASEDTSSAAATTTASATAANKKPSSKDEKQVKIEYIENEVKQLDKASITNVKNANNTISSKQDDQNSLDFKSQPSHQISSERLSRRTRSRSRSGDMGQVSSPTLGKGEDLEHDETSKDTPKRLSRLSRSHPEEEMKPLSSPNSAKKIKAETKKATPKRLSRQSRSYSEEEVEPLPSPNSVKRIQAESKKATPKRLPRQSRSHSEEEAEPLCSPNSAKRIQAETKKATPKRLQRQGRSHSEEEVEPLSSPASARRIQEKRDRGKVSRNGSKEEDEMDSKDKEDDEKILHEDTIEDTKLNSPVRKTKDHPNKTSNGDTSPGIKIEISSPKDSNKKDDNATEDEASDMSTSTKKNARKRGRPAKMTSPTRHSKSQDVPKIDIDNTDSNKTLDVGEDSDSNIPTEPPSPSRPEPSETRGKRKSRGRPPASARRSGRTRARTQADGEDTSEERNQSRRPSDSIPDDDAREEARSETAESEETDRPSAESDRDDLSSVAAGSLQPSMFADSLPGSPSSVTTEHEHDHTYRIWRKAIMLVWRTIAAHKYANIFLHPVTNDIAPGYCSIVHRRTDLTKVKKSIENGTIRTTEQFYRDIMLMFQNAIMYNNRDHDVYQMAVSMQNDAMQYIEEFISTQLMVQQPDSVKMLRSKDGGSRRLDAPAKEETDRQRRGSSEIETSGKKRRTRADEL